MREKAGISWIATRLLSFSCSVLRAYYWEEETAMRLFSPFFFSLICVLKSLYIFADAARIDPQYFRNRNAKIRVGKAERDAPGVTPRTLA
jgi:hypothetical protein